MILWKCCTQYPKTQQWPQDWRRSVSIPIPNKSSARECSNYWKIACISHSSKVMLKILQASLQQYMKWEPPDVHGGIIKERETRDQIANIRWIIKKTRVSDKHLLFLSWLLQSLWLWNNKLWKILKEMVKPDHLTCLLRNLYVGQEAIVRTGHGTINWF